MLASFMVIYFDCTNFGAPSGDRTRDLALVSHER
jgi:hypothetical protein